MFETLQNLSLDELNGLKKEIERLIALHNTNKPKKATFEIRRTDTSYKSWAKILTSVDTTQRNGRAFVGDFLNRGLNEAEVGSIIMHYYGAGSKRNYYVYVDVFRLTENGLEKLDASIALPNYKAEDWGLLMRDNEAQRVNGEG